MPSDLSTAIRTIFPKHPSKSLARLMNVSYHTAHGWIYRDAPRYENLSERRRELARVLLDEMNQQDAERDAIRLRLTAWVES